MSVKVDFARIRRWREERHWSQEHLADLAGIGLRTIQRIETGEAASQDTLKALAAAFQVDVATLYVDPEDEARKIVEQKHRKTRAAIRLSFMIHLASYVIGAVVFIGISLGVGYFIMKWPLIWWTVGIVAHGATIAIVEFAIRYKKESDP